MDTRLELRSVTKRYAGMAANDGVSLRVAPGEIHAILGENGAGKSTLMKVVYGAIQADSGDIFWQGEKTVIPSPAAARRLGIGMVYQHFSLFETVSVVENIAVAMEGPFDLPALAARVTELGNRYGLPVDPHRVLHHLSVGERQRVEILRCLLQDPKLLILDEPTSVLTPQAVRGLFDVLRQLAAGGCSILYISHKLDEIRELCDSATILRSGRVAGHARPKEVDTGELARLMVGAALPEVHRDPSTHRPVPRLEIAGLTAPSADPFGTALHDVSLTVHGGEIVGIAGISGNGQHELLSLLSERAASHADMIKVDGISIGTAGVAARRALGFAFVPEERLGRGAVPHMSLTDNALLTSHSQGLLRRGLIDRVKSSALARRIIDGFRVKCAGETALARSLSGGNLQKFIVGREMGLASCVLVVSQPTWGVDVVAAAFLRQSLIDLSRRGVAVLVISEELDELFEICDRIAVMCAGRLTAPKARSDTHVEEVGLLMSGVGVGVGIGLAAGVAA